MLISDLPCSSHCKINGIMNSFNPLQAGAAGALQNQVGKQQGGNQPSTAQPDRFGLLGLLSVIRMTDPDLTTLALGTDLTTLGLHLNSSDNVYKTFAHPWADNPLRPEPDFSVSSIGKQTGCCILIFIYKVAVYP